MTPGRTPRTFTRALALGGALALALATSTYLLAHDGDLKFLHKVPAHPGSGYTNAVRRAPGAGELDDNQRLALGATGFPHQGLTLLSWMTLEDFGVGPGGNANTVWGYTSPGNRRYALLGLSNGTAFVDVTVPSQPVLLLVFPGPANLARDVRTYQDHAYVVSEGGDGIQVFDLSQIDTGIVTYLGAVNDVGPSATHTLTIDEDSGFLYRSGGNSATGLRIYDVGTNPSSPTLVGLELLAIIHRRLEDTAAEREALDKLAKLDCDSMDVYRRLMELAAEDADWQAVAENAHRMLAVNPLLPVGHEMLARASAELDEPNEAVRPLAALAEMDPIDPADVHFRLAKAFYATGQRDQARREVLKALEEAPRYRAAQRLLLELIEQQPQPAAATAATSEAAHAN
jgi:tetratricopeptide (TPR) repeat protein